MKVILLLLLLVPFAALSQIESERTVTVETKLNKKEEIKALLLHEAVTGLIQQYATEMGFDYKTFEARLQEKFQKYFEAYKVRKLTEKFGKNYAQENPEHKASFLEGLELTKPGLFIKFARLEQILDTYAFKDLKADPEKPEAWKANIVLNLNKTKLEKLNARINSTETKQYSKLLLLSEINLIGLNWTALGLDQASTFTSPLMDSWLKWLETNGPTNVEEVRICQQDCKEVYQRWQELPQDEGMSVSEELVDGLWLKTSFNLRKQSFSPGLNEWEFSWDGSVVLLDMNTKKILSSYNLLPENKSFRGLDSKALNSQLASAMYRSALDAFQKASRRIQEGSRLNRLNRLVIQGQSHMGDVLSLMDLLKKEGQKINLELQIDHFTQKEAQILCFYQGEEKSFTDLLSRLKELKSSHSYRLVNEFTGVHHLLKLVAE